MEPAATLEILLSPSSAGDYTVELLFAVGDTRQPPVSAPARFDFHSLNAIRSQPDETGRRLGQAVLGALELQQYYHHARQTAQAAGLPLRLVLLLPPGDARLQGLRWEALCDPAGNGFLTWNANQPFSRLLQSEDWGPVQRRPKRQLRALLVVANPAELERGVQFEGLDHLFKPVDVTGEVRRAWTALAGIEKLSVLGEEPQADGAATLSDLKTHLLRGCDILYLVCHGALLPLDVDDAHSPRAPFILLEKPDGDYHLVEAEEVVTFIANLPAQQRPRLVVLASCQSGGLGRSDDDGALASFGPQLVEAGVPAVVAMQDNVKMATVERFMPAFFTALLQDGRLDAAMAAGRVAAGMDCPDWWAPVLYTRFRDGQLFGPPSIEETIQSLLQGMESLPVSYDGRIKNFLDEYLGTSLCPAPFGGRQAELKLLADWLKDPDAPPYALIASPAGRGKSALLAHWVQAVQGDGKTEVAFLPISLRFETASKMVAMTALAARLAVIYGRPVQGTHLTAEQLCEECLAYLQSPVPDGKGVLVVLDGLDEAAAWDGGQVSDILLPRTPPPGLRVVVSARYLAGDGDENGWLNRLGWQAGRQARPIPLYALTEPGVRDVLEQMRRQLSGDQAGQWGEMLAQPEIGRRLYALSQGDPLLVRLYVEGLIPTGGRQPLLTPEQLSTTPPGLAGYMDRWWEEQEKQWQAEQRDPLTEKAGLTDFLNVCAAALGPLKRADVAKVGGGALLSGMRLKGLLRRLVVLSSGTVRR